MMNWSAVAEAARQGLSARFTLPQVPALSNRSLLANGSLLSDVNDTVRANRINGSLFQDIGNASFFQEIATGSLFDDIANISIFGAVSNDSLFSNAISGSNIFNGSVFFNISNGSLFSDILNGSLFSNILNGSHPHNISNGSLFPEISNGIFIPSEFAITDIANTSLVPAVANRSQLSSFTPSLGLPQMIQEMMNLLGDPVQYATASQSGTSLQVMMERISKPDSETMVPVDILQNPR